MKEVEVSITRLANDDEKPIRIAVNVLGDPGSRIVVCCSLENFALALTGRGGVPAMMERNNMPHESRK